MRSVRKVLTNIGQTPSPTGGQLDLRVRVLDRTNSTGVWTPNDFLDLGSRAAIDKALQRLAASNTMLRMNQLNPARYIPGQSTTRNTDSRLHLSGVFGSVREVAGNSNSAYHAFQMFVNKRLSRGIAVTGTCTFSKFLDYHSVTNLGQFPQDPFNMRADRSRFDEDRTRVFNSSFFYEIPAWKTQKGVLRKGLGGWTASGMITWISGPPIHIRSGQDYSLTGVGWDRPHLVAEPRRSHASRDEFIYPYLEHQSFHGQPTGPLRQFRSQRVQRARSGKHRSFAVESFPFSERWAKLQFRGDFFNLFNSVRFGQPVALFNDRNFGRIQLAGDPRIVQLALRYAF